MKRQLTVRIEDEVRIKLDNIAEKSDRSLSFIIEKAIKEFIESNTEDQLTLKLE